MTVERKGASVCTLITAPNLEDAPAASGHLPPLRAGLGGVLLMVAPPICPTPTPTPGGLGGQKEGEVMTVL